MASTVVAEPGVPPSPSGRRQRKRWVIAGVTVVVLVAVGWFLGIRFYPFDLGPVTSALADASDSTVTIGNFRKTYFPPGCVAEDLVFRHSNIKSPLITIKKLTVRGSYLRIISQHVSRITTERMHVFIPPFGSGVNFQTHPSNIVVDEIIADSSIVDFASRDPRKPPVRFEIHEAALRNVGWRDALQYHVKVHNPQPPGEVEASGAFGVWKRGDAGETPISGKYTFRDADLGVYGGIAGILSSDGKFQGTLQHIDIRGTTDVPEFQVRMSGHSVHLRSEFDAHVDGTHGDTFLHRVDARFGRTHVVASGSIAGVKGQPGKTAKLELRSAKGRIDDILGLFVKNRRAPMSGETALRAKVEIPPGEDPFLQKVRLDGGFGVDAGNFTNAETQNDVNRLSAGARGENKDDPETVVSDMRGQVMMRGGIATFNLIEFWVPGAHAKMHGNYGIIDHKIDLHGRMRVDTTISKTTTGMKSFLLKMMDPFFKKKPKGEVIPVRISGTYEHPLFGVDVDRDPHPPPHGHDTQGTRN